MYVMNHFISGRVTVGDQTFDVPQSGVVAQTNGQDLATHANTCTQTFSKIPNFVAVDFYEQGSLLQTVAQLNGVTWNGKSPTAAPTSNKNAAAGKIGGASSAVATLAAAAAAAALFA